MGNLGLREALPLVAGRARKRAGRLVMDGFFLGLSRLSVLHPRSRPEAHGVERLRDLPYQDTGLAEHTLDVYRPVLRDGPLPVVLYVHGGGFRILSKDSHWVMGLAFAREGYLVFNVNYRLAPDHPYPAALDDVAAAFLWVAHNAARFGGDPARIVLAGESAGANLVTALAVASSFRRPEPAARRVFEAGVRPVVVLPACGVLQVSDPGRFTRRRRLPAWLFDRMQEVSHAYLGGADPSGPGGLELADPLVVLEGGGPPDRPLPPMFAFAGTRDPLLDDSRRLAAALQAQGVPVRLRIYPGEAHAFHVLVWRPRALDAWRETFTFLEQHLPGPRATEQASA